MNNKKVSFIDISQNKEEENSVFIEGISFQLTPKLLRQIILAKRQKSRLKLSVDISNKIDNYLIKNLDYLVFNTYYEQKDWLKTAITLEGNCRYYLQKDALNNPELTLDIVTAHNWLIGEVLRQLKPPVVTKKNRYDWLYWVLALVVVLIIVGLNWQILTPFNPLYIVLIVVVFFLLAWLLKEISLFLRR